MTSYFLRRLLSSIIALFIFLTLVFFVTEIIIPNDFTQQFAMQMNREQREQMQEELGLDRPLWERYFNWLNRFIRGSLGTSLYGFPITEYLKDLIPPTLLVFVTGTTIAFVFGQWLGKVVAWRGPGPISSTATFSSVVLYTTFPTWLAFLVTYFFARRAGWLRPLLWYDHFQSFDTEIWRNAPVSPSAIMLRMVLVLGAVVLILVGVNWILQRAWRKRLPAYLVIPIIAGGTIGGWFLLRFGDLAMDVLSVASLPLLTYVLLTFGETMLIMRTSMTDTLKEEYVLTARAKGLSEAVIRDKHAARNAILPVISRLVISLPYLLTGLVMIEDVFKWPGMSGALFWSLYNQDLPTVMGGFLVVGALSVVARLLLDVLHVALNPRIRFERGALTILG